MRRGAFPAAFCLPARQARSLRAALPLSNLSVSHLLASSPSRGASGEEAKLSGMPKPPLGRGGGSASALTERLSPAVAHGQALLRTTSQSGLRPPAPLVGEPLAKPFTLRGMPKPPLGRSCWGSGQQDASDSEADAGSRNPALASESETERAFLQKPLANFPEMRYNTSRGKSAGN